MARRFESGSVSKAQFCRAERISSGSLDHWLRVSREEQSEVGFIEANFVEVNAGARTAVPAEDQQPDIEVQLPFGVKLRFFGVNS
jgi:hypothetical protein